MQPTPCGKRPHKFRDAHPLAIGRLVELINSRIEQTNEFRWDNLPVPADVAVAVSPATDEKPAYLEFANGAGLEFRAIMRPEFNPLRGETTIWPRHLRQVDPGHVARIMWRFAKGAA